MEKRLKHIVNAKKENGEVIYFDFLKKCIKEDSKKINYKKIN